MLINKNGIQRGFVAFLLYNLIFNTISSNKTYNVIQLGMLVMLFIIIMPEIVNFIFKKKYWSMFIVICFYLILVYISAYINKDNHNITNSYYDSIIYIFKILGLFFGSMYLVKCSKRLLILEMKTFFYTAFLYCVVNDVVFALSYSSTLASKTFLLGNKFDVSYVHIQMVVFFWFLNMLEKKVNLKMKHLYFIIAYSFVICLLCQSATGAIGLIIVIICTMFLSEKLLFNYITWLVCALYSTLFALFYDKFISNIWIQYIITKILGRSLTLTGRTAIYKNIPQILNNHLYWGYGYGSSYEVWWNYMKMPNSQNGFIDCIVEQGLYATIVIFIMVLVLFSVIATKRYRNVLKPFMAIIFMYTLLGSIEVTISLKFFGFIILLYFLSKDNTWNIDMFE